MSEQNNSSIDTNLFTKPVMITDLNTSYIPKEACSFVRNGMRGSKDGDAGTIGNEPSPLFTYAAPYKIVGIIPLHDNTHLVFSTDNTDSEIGLGNPETNTYSRLKNLRDFNFHQDFPVHGVAKSRFQKGTVAYFTDKRNPVRRVELKKLPALSNVDDILLFRKITHPHISVQKGSTGNMPNGSYSVAIAYSIDGQVYSDLYSLTNRVSLHSLSGSNSLEITLSGLDREFDTFFLFAVGSYIDPVTKGTTKLAKRIGEYSTRTSKISLTDFLNPDYQEVPLSTFVARKKVWQKAGIISSNSNYLMLGDLVSRPEDDYQSKAMQIISECVIEQVDADYYEQDGSDVGYYRDENYDFYIQGITTTGEETVKWQIPGPKPTARDLAPASGADVYEHNSQFANCDQPELIPYWKVYNTASDLIPYNNEFKCNRRVLGYCKPGYHASTELYPANFGQDAHTPIRLHRTPDESRVPRYSTVGARTYVNIIGFRFRNIPAFDSSDIIGYKITRSDRKGGNGTVVARGIMPNIRSYTDSQTGQEVLYPNYGVNYLGADPFLSSTQTRFKNGREESFTPLSAYYKDKFTFLSPHTLFEPRYSLGNEIRIECEEVAQVTGQFEKVYNHPRQKLMNQFSFWLSAAIGFIEVVLTLAGKSSATGTTILSAKGVTAGVEFSFNKDFKINSVEDLINLDIVGYIASQVKAGAFDQVLSAVKTVLTSIVSLGLKVPYSIFSGIRQADEIFTILHNFTGYTDYVYQYNAHALFNQSLPVSLGNKRRGLNRPATYLPSTVVSVGDKVLNNLGREKSVYLELNATLSDPRISDNSLQTASQLGIGGDIGRKTTSSGSAYYVTSKVSNPNQYGQVGSAPPVSMHGNVLYIDTSQPTQTTPILYGGDCIIGRMQVMRKMPFFNQDLANTGYTDGVEYDYRMYRNVAYPRFWMDSTKFDFGTVVNQQVVNFTKFGRTTASKHNLDCKKANDGKSITRIDDAYMYLSHNTVLDFFVECDYNINFRQETSTPHYSKTNTNLSQLFRSDRLGTEEEFAISRAYSDLYTTEIYPQPQRHDFSPLDTVPAEQPNSVIYSLPSFNLQDVDNWQYFLPANYFAFTESDFGKLTSVHKLDQDRLIFLFSKSSPYVSVGKDFLELEGSGRKITIGDGGLFAQDPREVMPTDDNYGSCSSRFAFANTHMGRYYPSVAQGRILNFTDSLQSISREGMANWCALYMPILLKQHFPAYTQEENPVSGVGYLMVFDGTEGQETLYITKRDFVPKKEYVNDITYDAKLNRFYFKGNPVSLRDTAYFYDCSWTISYSYAEKGFISFHDWHPDLTIQADAHFLSVKDNKVYWHNKAHDSYCNYYGVQYPFEVEFVSSSGQQVETLRSIEYFLEVYKYKAWGRDRFHVLNANFDRLLVRNSEQISPVLNLVLAPNNPRDRYYYPRKSALNNISHDVLYTKEEQKYRINHFWDSTKDRGEFTRNEYHLFPADESGYKRTLNPLSIDIDKPPVQRKKFRHHTNLIRLSKTDCADLKFLVKLNNTKKLLSPR